MYSIAHASIPEASAVRQVVVEALRTDSTTFRPCASVEQKTSARMRFGAGETVANVICVMTPSVPSDPMKRSMRSMSGAAKYPAEHFATRGIV